MKSVYWMRGLKGAFVGLFFLISQSAVWGSAVEEEKLSVVVSILPQAFLVERIGGSHVSLEVLVKPGASPATYAPTPSQVRTLSQADVYFHIGVPFENKFLPTIREMFPAFRSWICVRILNCARRQPNITIMTITTITIALRQMARIPIFG